MSFSYDLFDFTDCELFASSCSFYICQEAKIASYLDDRKKFGLSDVFPICCCPVCCACMNRVKLREKYKIEGQNWMDFLKVCCCSVCSQTQQMQEIIKRDKHPIRMFMDVLPPQYD
eukprot:TRINITY_DN7281_c0_g1_i1.p1 TRINITY_DN7281_c0_g1~~TRINITY_DN7281_c0_g1_i1.p1  ORF type:complete len:116 (-),score=12.82 TRINITY_DN7281_c0_g1_i1:74-421(-)